MARTLEIDPQTGKPYRMCRRCTSAHPMKQCPLYKRRVKNAKEDGETDSSTVLNTPECVSTASLSFRLPDRQSAEPSTCPDTHNRGSTASCSSHLDGLMNRVSNSGTPSSTEDDSIQGNLTTDPPHTPDHVIDPVLLAISDTARNNTPVSSPSQSRSSSPLQLIQGDDTNLYMPPPGSPTGSTSPSPSPSPRSSPSPSDRQRPSKRNPCFGHVAGVYRGSSLLAVRRTRKRQPEHAVKPKNIPKVFYDRSRSIMTKLEDFALDTECWMHFSVQHPTCTQPFIHYTSPRLRTEGGMLLDTLHETNYQLYGSLMTARRRDTSQIAAELAEAKAKLADAEAQTKAKVAAACADAEKAADVKLSEAQAAKEAAEKEATQLRAALALAGIVIPGLTK